MENNAKQILSNLYSLLMEINFHMDGPELMADLSDKEKERVNKHYKQIKLLKAKYKAEANRQFFYKAMEQIQELKERGIEELKKLVKPEEQQALVPLFRKFEELTENDKASVLEDTELLALVELLKQRVDESEH